MTDPKESKKGFSTCMENIPLAEIMQKMTGEKGIGSLCGEMMKMVRENKEGASFSFAEMMKFMKGCCGTAGETKEPEKEEDR